MVEIFRVLIGEGVDGLLFMINQILLNIVIVLIPIIIHQIFFFKRANKFKKSDQIFNGILYAISSILCLNAPIEVSSNFEWDLRSIPIIIAILYSYGKYAPGVIALVAVSFASLFIDRHMQILSIISTILIVMPSFFFLKNFQSLTPLNRSVISIITAALSYFILLIVILLYFLIFGFDPLSHLSIFGYISLFGILSILGVGLCSLLYEYLLDNYNMRRELERNEKLKIVSQLAASVAHEVRNPLTVVKGFLQLMSESVDDKKKGYLSIALSELERAEFIITDYLNLAKPHPDKLTIIELKSFLSSILEMMHSYGVIQNVDLQLNCSQQELYVLADKPKLSQVIVNLIKNGVEAIPDKGDVIINGYKINDEIVLEIIDNGKGMSKEVLDSIGTAFFTTKSTGTGLGTLVTLRLIEGMGGKITFESKEGRGTKVTIRMLAATHDMEGLVQTNKEIRLDSPV